MNNRLFKATSSLLLLCLMLNFTPAMGESELNIIPEITPIKAISELPPDTPTFVYERLNLGWEEKIDQVYVAPSSESKAKTADRVRTFDCSTVTDVPPIECEALVALYDSANGVGWKTKTNWLSTTIVDDWYGVKVTDGYISELTLTNNQLSGYIPTELGSLSKLTVLNLASNALRNNIPSELGNLTSLVYLNLPSNWLEGSIPSELGNLTNLYWLDLSINKLSGSIPAQLGNLSNLSFLFIETNINISGSIPPELGELSNLVNMWLNGNSLSGSIPAEIGKLAKLEVLDLRDNRLSGSIPSELGNLKNVYHLYLHTNQLSGSIPPELGGMTS